MEKIYRNPRFSILLLSIIAILLITAILFTFYGSTSPSTATVIFSDTSETILAQVELQISDTMATRYIGLSQTNFLDENQGMLLKGDVHVDTGLPLWGSGYGGAADGQQ